MASEDLRPFLVTGATGNVGRHVVKALEARGARVRIASTQVARARAEFGAAHEYVVLDFRDPSTFDAAVQGARGVFLLRPPAIAKVAPTLNALVDRAIAAGVEHVVFLSVTGAETQRFVPHHGVEQHLFKSKVAWTILRPGFFAQNFGDQYRDDVVKVDRVYVPAGRGRVAFVDVRDVAELAAVALLDPSHRGQAYTLTGPAAVSFDEAAAILSQVTGRAIRYESASIAGYVRHLRRGGASWGQALIVTALHVGLRFGNAETIDPSLGTLLGRAPRTLADYVRDHAGVWSRG